MQTKGKKGFPGCSDGKESACSAGDLGSISGLGRSPGGGNGYRPQYSCLEYFMDRGTWRAAVRGGHKELDRAKQLTLALSTQMTLPLYKILDFIFLNYT